MRKWISIVAFAQFVICITFAIGLFARSGWLLYHRDSTLSPWDMTWNDPAFAGQIIALLSLVVLYVTLLLYPRKD